jgi:sugar O-acyltransferase (sialic acid O-acetyltransferase NeuD family)
MKNIAIYGAGGLGRELYCILFKMNREKLQWNFSGFFDDGIPKGTRNEYGVILGGIQELNEWSTPIHIVLAFGDGHTIEKVSQKINNPNVDYPNICYQVWFADKHNISMGKGNIILGGSCLSCGIQLGDFNVLNGFANIGHDVKIGSFNTFMPGVIISGETVIGNNNFFGIGSIVIQQLKIGNGTRLGGGGVLMTKPKEHSTYLGNPAKIFKY